MKEIVAQHLTHRGTVVGEGFLFSAKLLPEPEMRRRVLLLWRPGARIFRHSEFVFLQFQQSFRIDCRRALGLPLVRFNQVLSSFPLSAADFVRFKDLNEAIVFFRAGELQTIELQALAIENIETWFDVADFEIVTTETLGEIQTKPVLLEKVTEVNLRQGLKTIPQADAEMFEILKALRQKKAESLKSKTNSIVSNQKFSKTNALGSSFSNIFAGGFDWIKNLFAGKGNQSLTAPSEPQKPSEIFNRLRRLWTKALFQMQIAQIFGRKQAQYLAKMMEMFENGDLEEALKYAIPLEDMQALRELTEQTPFLGFLRPRNSLQISFGRPQSGASSSVFLENDWFQQLSQTYRQTFERLVAQGKIEEAAFVLAELLKSNAEAVEFLEKHGKLQLAAELAEARNLPKEVIVRQWFIAGEKRRAIQLAVLHNCFEYVVTKLEKENHPQSGELRELWADNLAASGNLPAAINTIWSLETRREKAKDWMDQAIAFGGLPAAQMLVKKIILFPQSFPEVKEKLVDFLSETSPEAAEKRIGFAREATIQKANDELRMLARPVVRKILAEWAENSRRFSVPEFRQLVTVTNDFALRTDLPKLPPPSKSELPEECFSLEIAARDQGANRIFDACLLPDGKIAIALGEAGVKILSRENKTLAHFDQPTQKFVVSDFGTTAIGLMRRGQSSRLTKFDFARRTANYWCESLFERYAPTFDGNLWFVGSGDAIYAIDTTAKDFAAVWRVSEIGGNVYEISRSKTKLIILITMPGKGFEKWSYDLPGLVLRSRNQVKGWHETTGENQSLRSLSASVAYSIASKQEYAEDKVRFNIEIYDYETRIGRFSVSDDVLGLGISEVVEKQYFIVSYGKEEAIVTLYSIPNRELALFRLHGTNSEKALFVKLDEKFLTITDELGRIIVFDCQARILRKNLRY